MTREEVTTTLRQIGLASAAERIADLCRSCIRFHARPVDDREIAIGASKLGGLPDLPWTLQWPEAGGGYPLKFLCQVNLGDLKAFPEAAVFPPDGRLYFFYDVEEQPWGFDPGDRAGWRVQYGDGRADSLVRRGLPEQMADGFPLASCTPLFRQELSLPHWNARCLGELGLNQPDLETYASFLDGLHPNACTERVPMHQILGHPQPLQDEMQLECQLVSHGISTGSPAGFEDPRVAELAPGAAEWRLLLQVDSDDKPGWMWGDEGKLYFWIREQDLRNRFFDNVWMILQCG